MSTSWFTAQVILVGLCAVMTSSSPCEFPTFMTRMSFWRTQVTEQRVGSLWTFPTRNQAKLINMRPGELPEIIYFNCETAIGQETFIANITALDAAETSYQCLKFIRRSDFVVQLATSTVFNTISQHQCHDPTQLVVQDLVLINPTRDEALVTDVISCGLVGGYWLSAIDSAGSHTCRDAFLRPIIEADCILPGEGMLMDFRQPTCSVASSTTNAKHELVCLGSWTQSGFNYSVLTDNKPWPTLWMLRLPEVASGPITAHLLTSLSTAADNSTVEHQHPISLTPASFPTVCEDEATGCDVTAVCADDTKEVHCQKTCDACAVTPGGPLHQFNETYSGQWFETSHRYAGDDGANRIVTMTNSTLQVAGQPAWHCIEFNSQRRYLSVSSMVADRLPVAMLFEEPGCRPRLACIEILWRSRAVIQYRVSRHITWPATDSIADEICSDSMFTAQNVAELPPSLQYRLLISREKYNTSTVPCQIDAWYHMNGSNSGGQHFEGFIHACGSDDTTFHYVTRFVTSSTQVLTSETHRCLATFTERIGPAEFIYIITAGEVSCPGAAPRLFCWLVEKSPSAANTRMYLTHAADCYRQTAFDNSPTNFIAQFDMLLSETGQEWSRNCSSSHRVPMPTPGLVSTVSTPGLGSTTSPIPTEGDSKAQTLLANTAAVAFLTSMTLTTNLLR